MVEHCIIRLTIILITHCFIFINVHVIDKMHIKTCPLYSIVCIIILTLYSIVVYCEVIPVLLLKYCYIWVFFVLRGAKRLLLLKKQCTVNDLYIFLIDIYIWRCMTLYIYCIFFYTIQQLFVMCDSTNQL